MTGTPPFTARAVGTLVAIGITGFLLMILFSTLGNDFDLARQSGANSFSRSAIGHRAFVETLKEIGIPVLVSRNETAAKVDGDSVVMILEPQPVGDESVLGDIIEAALRHDASVLYVLPKWSGAPSQLNPSHLGVASLFPDAFVQKSLDLIIDDAEITRPDGDVTWTEKQDGIVPTIDQPQLIETDELAPIVAAEEGILIGRRDLDGDPVIVISDPDILSTHGLGDHDNAVIAVGLVEELLPEGGGVLIDETHHGFLIAPNLVKTMFQTPYVVATMMMVLAVLLVIWATAGRFGAPLPPRRAIQLGRRELIENTARLLIVGGHHTEILNRYGDAIRAQVARALHAPWVLNGEALTSWLDRIGGQRRVSEPLRQLLDESGDWNTRRRERENRLVRLAQRLDRWRREMTHGS